MNTCITANKKPKGLFLNSVTANCSIHESGKMMFAALVLSDKYEIDYLEIDENQRNIPSNYDFYAFNYHHMTMSWLETKSLKKLPGVKITFVLEVLPNDPFVLCPDKDFDAYCPLDPTINIPDKRVYAFPRPLENFDVTLVSSYQETEIPTIGSFGFATIGKGFELVVDAVNKEFERAIIKINIPSATYADDHTWRFHKRNYAEYLADLCKKVAKPGIEVIITNNFLTKLELIKWCSQNTLNCFLYNRDQPGLSATTDQAISSGRPLAVSNNETFRHIQSYIKPYPYQTLKESIANSQIEVLQMQKDWQPISFARKFESVLNDFNLFSKVSSYSSSNQELFDLKQNTVLSSYSLSNKIVSKYKKAFSKVKKIIIKEQQNDLSEQIKIVIDEPEKRKVLVVSHKEKQCGIYQYGVNITAALQKSSHYSFRYVECSNSKELAKAIAQHNPEAIIYNYYPATMPWLNPTITRQYTLPQLGIMHEVTQEEADQADQELFDYHLCPDPTLQENTPYIFKTHRLIIPYINAFPIPNTLTIGSFGFGFSDKGFERLIETVQNEFDEAKIIINMPFNSIVDKGGKTHAIATAKRCQAIIKKPGIKLTIKHDFLTRKQMLDFLAKNTLNAFFYDSHKTRGISSCIEHALAVQRPIAITKCGMFRHVYSATPSICIEDTSLKQIIHNGIAPLVPFYNEWSEPSFILRYENILDKVLFLKTN